MSTLVREDDRTADDTFRASAYPPWWRIVGAAAFGGSRAVLPLIPLVVLRSLLPVMPLTVIRWFALYFAVPALAAVLLRRALAADVGIGADAVTIARRGVRVEVPRGAIRGIVPWNVPLPAPGFGIVLASGRRLAHGIAAADPTPLLRALGARGVAGAAAAVDHPIVVYARARAAYGEWRWYHLAARFPLFALIITAPLFNVHQHIAYGALLGEYYLRGLRSYLTTFAAYWATVTIYHVCYASIWRGIAEAVCLVGAAVAPSRAARVRRAAELTIRVLYYGGVPVLLALRFASW